MSEARVGGGVDREMFARLEVGISSVQPGEPA